MTAVPPHDPSSILTPWIGKACDEVLRREHDWTFQFGEAGPVVAECPWRIIAEGEIALAGEDDGHQFGLPKPVDGVKRAMSLLSGRPIISVEVSPISSDLKVHFEGDATLELFNNSSGYQAWQATVKRDGKSSMLIAQGGGQMSIWNG